MKTPQHRHTGETKPPPHRPYLLEEVDPATVSLHLTHLQTSDTLRLHPVKEVVVTAVVVIVVVVVVVVAVTRTVPLWRLAKRTTVLTDIHHSEH